MNSSVENLPVEVNASVSSLKYNQTQHMLISRSRDVSVSNISDMIDARNLIGRSQKRVYAIVV